MGGRLVVGISSDEFNLGKGKESFFSYQERAEIVGSCKYVDEVFPEHNWDQKVDDIKKYNADVFAIGDDWQGKFDDLQEYCEVVYLPRTAAISMTSIKKKISQYSHADLENIEHSLHGIISLIKSLSDQKM